MEDPFQDRVVFVVRRLTVLKFVIYSYVCTKRFVFRNNNKTIERVAWTADVVRPDLNATANRCIRKTILNETLFILCGLSKFGNHTFGKEKKIMTNDFKNIIFLSLYYMNRHQMQNYFNNFFAISCNIFAICLDITFFDSMEVFRK